MTSKISAMSFLTLANCKSLEFILGGKPHLHASGVVVTVGLCIKNSELTLKEALQSVIDQDFPHGSFELVVVDGHSRDNTLEVVRACLSKSDIRAEIFYENQGLPQARQIVVDNANGRYVVWVDGDMVLTRGFLTKQVEFMEKNPLVGVAKGKYANEPNSNQSVVATLENVEFLLNTLLEGETDSKVLGTSGCIYRISALRDIGGFDFSIKGVGEDMDVENRIRNAGWSLHVTSAMFYETRRQNWRALWNEYFWHGCGGRRLFKKNRHLFELYKMLPPLAIVAEFFRVPPAYRLTRRKVVLLLPFHYAFKRLAWFSGFIKSGFE
jgi:glycosyltransferase involved in cell wall biosynthesis